MFAVKIADIKEIQYGHQANHWKTIKDKMLPKKKQCFSIVIYLLDFCLLILKAFR